MHKLNLDLSQNLNQKTMNTILIIEDHEMMRLFLVNLFSKEYEVKSVSSPEEAANWLQNNEADMIVGDFPNSLNSIGLHQISSLTKQNNIPWIVLTDQDKSDQRIKAFQWGAKDSLSKPFNPQELTMRVKTHLPAFSRQQSFRTVA